MTTDLYSTVFFQDGEQLTHDDMNSVQRLVQAAITDQLLECMVPGVALAVSGGATVVTTEPTLGGLNGANAPTVFAYALAPGSAFLRQGSANNKIQIAPGTLGQKTGNSDGLGSTFLWFDFDGTSSAEWTLTNGDATNPRVDLLQMALSYTTDTPANVDFQDQATRMNTTVPSTATRRRVQCVLSVKAGTPAASPVIPDPDAGCVAVGTVVVGHGWATGGTAPIFGIDSADANNAVVHDQRMPLGVRGHRADPVLYKINAAWTLGTANQFVTAGGAGTNLLFIGCGATPGRLICIDTKTAIVAAGSQRIGPLQANLGGAPNGGAVMFGNLLSGFNGSGLFGDTWRSTRTAFEASHVPAAGPTIQQSAVAKIGVPVWSTGYRTPTIPVGGFPACIGISWSNITAGQTLGETTFYLACGL